MEYKCEFCDKEFTGEGDKDPKAQLHGHTIHCPKNPTVQARRRSEGIEPERKERIPFGMPTRKFSCPTDDGFHYRVINDNWSKEPGRVQRAKAAGYEIVDTFEPLAVGTNEDGSAIKGVLMRIPEELYEEDQKLKQVEVDKVDEQIKSGTLERKKDDKRYSPSGIRVWDSHNENS